MAKTFRTLVRFHRTDEHGAWAAIPTWDPEEEVFFAWRTLPNPLVVLLKRDLGWDGLRLYGQVNLYAESEDELYVKDWEVPGCSGS